MRPTFFINDRFVDQDRIMSSRVCAVRDFTEIRIESNIIAIGEESFERRKRLE
jgi:hypothetical protein